METQARFGYEAATGSTNDGRFRRLTIKLPAAYAERLFAAQDQGADDQQMREIVAEGLKDIYFQANGTRAIGLSEVSLRYRLPRHRKLREVP